MSDATANPLGNQAFRSAGAHFMRAFFLVLAALTGAPFAVGLTLLVFVYAVGVLSGSHFNLAAASGLVASRRFPFAHGPLYIVAQVAGALLARLVAGAGLVGELAPNYYAGTMAAELVGSGMLMVTVAATTEKQGAVAGSDIAVGGALLAGWLISKRVRNPAAALATGLATSPVMWATGLSAVVFRLLFPLAQHTRPAEVKDDSKLLPKALVGYSTKTRLVASLRYGSSKLNGQEE